MSTRSVLYYLPSFDELMLAAVEGLDLDREECRRNVLSYAALALGRTTA